MKPVCGLPLVLLFALTLVGCGDGESAEEKEPAPSRDGHAQMLQALENIRESSRTNDAYFEDRSVTRMEVRLEVLGPDGAADERFSLHWELGTELLRLGRNADAIRHLEAAEVLVPDVSEQMEPEHHDLLLLDLAVAWLRVGETANCVHCTTGETCLFPIQPGGVHLKPQGSSKALPYLRKVLERNPRHASAHWLINVVAMTLGQYPDAVPEEFLIPSTAWKSDESMPRFRDVAESSGVRIVDCSGGAIADDFDGDGHFDLVTSSWDRSVSLHFFRNRGDGTFEDRSDAAGFQGLFGGLNLIHADYDNDGDLDIYVLRGAWLDAVVGQHPNSLLQNDGSGHFRDVTFDVGLGTHRFPTQTAAWGDFDNDGRLDLYVGNEKGSSRLYRNANGASFEDVTDKAGVSNGLMAKGVVWGDYDADGWPDLYVSNMGAANHLYRNNRDGTFSDVAVELGVAGPDQSFGVWFWDYNNDGALDLYVPSYVAGVQAIVDDYLDRPSTAVVDCLYEGDGQGGFHEVAQERGLTRATLPMGCNFGDLDNDGWLDFYLGTGYTDFNAIVPNLMFRNQSGRGFADVTSAGGFGHLQKGHGIAFADFDRDGDQDVFIQMGGAYPADTFGNVLFQNPGFERNWIELHLIGSKSNRCAIGAQIRLLFTDGGESRQIVRYVNSGGSFGANPLRQHIGVGDADRIDTIEIRWPGSATLQKISDIVVNQRLTVRED